MLESLFDKVAGLYTFLYRTPPAAASGVGSSAISRIISGAMKHMMQAFLDTYLHPLCSVSDWTNISIS